MMIWWLAICLSGEKLHFQIFVALLNVSFFLDNDTHENIEWDEDVVVVMWSPLWSIEFTTIDSISQLLLTCSDLLSSTWVERKAFHSAIGLDFVLERVLWTINDDSGKILIFDQSLRERWFRATNAIVNGAWDLADFVYYFLYLSAIKNATQRKKRWMRSHNCMHATAAEWKVNKINTD